MGICDSNVTGPCKPCWTFARPAQHSRPPLSLMVGEGLFFSVLQREPKQQVSHQIGRLCDKFDSLQPDDPRRNTIVGYIAWLNVEFQAGD
jgi:hypothetical protein